MELDSIKKTGRSPKKKERKRGKKGIMENLYERKKSDYLVSLKNATVTSNKSIVFSMSAPF